MWQRFVDWVVGKDERFYRALILIALAFFGVLTIFWMLAAGGLVATFMWWVFYEMVIKKSGHHYIPVQRK